MRKRDWLTRLLLTAQSASKRDRLAHKALAQSARERDWLKRLLLTAQSTSERERLAYKALAHSSEHTVLSLTFNVDEPKKMANLRHKLTPHFMPR